MRAYTRLLLQLVCFLLRAQAELDLPAEVEALVVALRQALNQEVEKVMAAIHQLLLGLWMREWTPTRDNQFPDPTVRFVIHTQVNADGSLKKPEVVLSAGIVSKANWKFFVPNDQSTLQPDGVPCRKYSMVPTVL